MFFRRMFSRKNNGTPVPLNSNRHSAGLPHSPKKIQRNSSSKDKRGLSVLQLTPLWEHVIRTRTLPEDLNPVEMFEEFLERLRDPEWQVRQHALRVLVDVLIVIGQKADSYFSPIIPQLVENLGHPAPTVRKGALDCLRVYISNTSMPETILLEVLDIGLNQRITNEPFGGRLTCGVMLSLPSLIQATLHTSKRNYILRTTINMLINKMTQVTHQEITLKVLLRIKDLIGPREFAEYMTHGDYREFDLLCNVYGLDNKKTPTSNRVAWALLSSFESDDSEPTWYVSDNGHLIDSSDNGNDEDFKDKVIMETEIKIKDDTLTMRIVETNDELTENRTIAEACSRDEVDDIVNINDVLENSGIIQVFSDSEVDESNGYVESDVRRTPKKVTFGGEVVKMRTPDSDTVTHSDADERINKSASSFDKFNFLSVEIPNDNTQPIDQSPKIKKELSSKDSEESLMINNSDWTFESSPKEKSPVEQKRTKSASPRSPFRRISISPVDNIISPKPPHKEIEVLHNLQRSPCPSPGIRAKRQTSKTDSSDNDDRKTEETPHNNQVLMKSWDELGLVDQHVLNNLKSGDWRHRSQSICSIEEALRSSENLALVIPHLDSLLRTLLSSERNVEVVEDKRRIVKNLISRIPLDNLENRTNQIITGLCRQGGAGSNLVCKALMQRMHPAAVVLKLLSEDFLHAKSSRFRENALQMVMYALMTFPSTCFDTNSCVTRATYAALDRKRRVRQASLDVLAILGQIASPRSLIEIVQNIGNTRDDGNDLCTAVKARLARKQLPMISADGFVQYALRVPSPQLNDPQAIRELGADIEWITSGVGSVSPTSMQRRLQKLQYIPNDGSLNGKHASNKNRSNDDGKPKAPHEILGVGAGVKHINDSRTWDERNQIQHSLATRTTLQPKVLNSGEIIGVHGKRIATKSCSDSSQDGRSSDSTSDNLRHVRSSVTSRFPAMESLEVTGMYIDAPSYRSPFMELHSHRLNATFPKTNFSVHQTKVPRSHYGYETYTESSFDESANNIKRRPERNSFQSIKRFANVEKFILESNKPHHQQLQQLYLPSNVIHQPQPYGVRQEEEAKKIEIHTKPSEQHQATPRDNKTELQISTPFKQELSNREGFVESSELSSEDRYSSGHSTPTRVMGETVTPSRIQSNLTRSSERSSGTNSPDKSTPSNRALLLENVDFEGELHTTTNSTNFIKNYGNDFARSEMEKERIDQELEIVENIIINAEGTMGEKSKEIQVPDILYNESETTEEKIEKQIVQNTELLTKIEPISEIRPVEREYLVEPFMVQDEIDSVKLDTSVEFLKVLNINSIAQNTDIIAEIVEKEEKELISEINLDSIYQLNQVHPSPIPTMEVKPITRESTISKSSDSIFEPSLKHETDTKSITSTETSSDYQPSHAASLDDVLPINGGNDFIQKKPQHVPLLRKSKTTLFGRNRKVCPVKQSIKLSKAELYPQSLTKFDRPKEGFNQMISQLDSSNWETIMMGLCSLVRLMRYHPDVLDINMHLTCIQLARSAKNLRSQVARAACQAATELFTIRTKHLEQECDDLVGSLLHRTADTNRFLRADATRALEAMCDNLTPQKVLHLLTNRGITHQNAMVRTTTAKLLNRLASRIGCDRIFNMNRENRDKFIITGANLLLEGSLETRSYAKALFRFLSSHHNYNSLLLEVIPSRTYRNIEKTLKNI